MTKLLRDLFYACAAGALLGSAIGLLIRIRRERRAMAQRARGPSHCGTPARTVIMRWTGKYPNSIG
jgi:hypothetical protein